MGRREEDGLGLGEDLAHGADIDGLLDGPRYNTHLWGGQIRKEDRIQQQGRQHNVQAGQGEESKNGRISLFAHLSFRACDPLQLLCVCTIMYILRPVDK